MLVVVMLQQVVPTRRRANYKIQNKIYQYFKLPNTTVSTLKTRLTGGKTDTNFNVRRQFVKH